MNGAAPNLVTINLSSRWLSIPPVVAIFTAIAARFFSSGTVVPVDPAIWGLAGLMFVLLTFLYGIFIRQHFSRGLLPVQLTAQGVLLCPLALRVGAAGLAWVGVLLAICGAVLLVALYYFRPRFNPTVLQEGPASELDRLPLPFAITDAEGGIISASNFLLRMAHKSRDAINGAKIDALFPLDQEIINMGGKDWRVLQTPMEDGTYYFQLEEERESSVSAPLSVEVGGGFFDAATSLYTRSYATKRIEEEFYRIYRYKRWMSAALLRVNFMESETSYGPNPKKEDEIFNAYCRFVSLNTRETDISCVTAPNEILIVMPESELEGARDVVSKLLDFTAQLKEKTQGYDGIMEVLERTLFFNASSGVIDFDRLMEKLDEQGA